MPSHDPFAFLRTRRPGAEDGEEEAPGPFDFLRPGAPIGLPQIPQRETATENFLEGMGRGFLYPVKAITGELEADSPDEGLAGTVGEFVGAGVAFVPFFKAGRAVTTGIGLLKPVVGREGVKRLVPTAAGRVIEGALSFGAFEAFSGETIAEAPTKAVQGAAIGAAFEVGFLSAAAAWRGRFGAFQGVKGGAVKKPIPEVSVHPDALNIERWLFPTGGEEAGVFAAKMRAASNPEGQLEIAIAEIGQRFMPGGQVILPGMQNPARVEAAARKMGLLTGAWYPKGVGSGVADVFLVDTSRTFLKTKEVEIFKKYLGGVGLEADEFIKMIREDLPVHLKPGATVGKNSVGSFRYIPEIRAAIGSVNYQHPHWKISLLAHEYAHFITARVAAKRGGIVGRVTSMAGDLRVEAKFEEVFELGAESVARVRKGGDIWQEFWELTEVVEIKKARELIGSTADDVLKGIAESPKDRLYFERDREMLSRAVEAMLYDPKGARILAPRATRLVSKLILNNSPKLRDLMSPEIKVIDDVLRDLWIRRGKSLTILEQGSPQVTKANLRQFSQKGFFPGMEGFVSGESVELLARTKLKDGAPGLLIRNIDTGRSSVVPEAKVMRPLFPNVVRRETEVLSAVGKVLETKPKWLSVWLRGTQDVAEEAATGVKTPPGGIIRRGVVDLEGFEFVDDLGKWIRANRGKLDTTITQGEVRTDVATRILDKSGSAGLVVNDNGALTVILGRNTRPVMGEEVRGAAWGNVVNVAGSTSQTVLTPSLDDTLRALLMEEGVAERELPYFMDTARRLYEKQLRVIVDPEVREALEAAEQAIKFGDVLVDDASEMVVRSGMVEEVTDDGLRHVTDRQTGAPIGRFASEDDLVEYMKHSGFEDSADDLIDGATPSNIAHGNGGGAAGPPKFQQQMGPDPEDFSRGTRSGRLFDTGNVFGAIITAMENFASSAQQRGLGPALTHVFEPGQKAMIRVLSEMSEIKRELLGNITFSEQFKKLEKLLRPIPKERREIITQYIESLSREEVARPGGLLKRGMNANEIRIAEFFSDAGIGAQIPRLMSIKRLTESALAGESTLNNTIRKMRQIKLSEDGQVLLSMFENMPRFKSADEIFDFLNLDEVHRKAIKIIEQSSGTNKNDFSIFAVSKYAMARPLGKGFKTGREQFAAEQGMNAIEKKVADELDKVFATTFSASGLDPARELGGYWPHMRVWAQHGFEPLNVPGLKNDIPESLEWSALRFRTGELDIYNRDPLVSAYKHARGMLMKQHFDPVLPGMKKALEEIKTIDTRTYRIMAEYVDELLGMPHETFKRAQSVIDGTAKAMGLKVPEQTVTLLVNNLAALAAGAAIPFRPALIVRNYFQMIQTVAPRVGLKTFWDAVGFVVNPQTRKEAYRMARKAEAILPNFSPIHASTEIFGSPEAGRLSYRLQLMLEKGFEWYKNADDMGRAVAYHAQRMRIEKHLGKYAKGQIDIDEFASLAKLDTYKPIDAQRARAMFESGRYEEAKEFLGMKLARETIFRYGLANHPAGWNSIFGRLFGQFGTWPTQFKDYLGQGLTHGSTKDKAEFAFMNLAINGGVLAGGAAVGINAMSWVTFPSLTYTGGPFADMAIDVVRSMSGSDTEKSLARHSLLQQVPVLGWAMTGDPRSVFVPGSYLLGDLKQATEQDNWLAAFAEGAGFDVLERGEEVPGIQWALDMF